MPSTKTPEKGLSDAEKTKKINTEPFIGTKDQAEPWMVQNKNIKNGYRINFNDGWKCFKSLFMIHNETGNVWSHLLGALIFVWFGIYVTLFMQPPSV
jgi:hypothetical protein